MLVTLWFVVPLFALIATAFIPFGQLVGWYLENAPRGVSAYSVNVLAGLAGIAGFTLLCFLDHPPWIWLLAAAFFLLTVVLRSKRARTKLTAVFPLCNLLLAIPDRGNGRTYWSPYQKLAIMPIYVAGRLDAYSLTTNDSIYQTIVNLSPEFVRSHPAAFERFPLDRNSYNLPYRFYPAPA